MARISLALLTCIVLVAQGCATLSAPTDPNLFLDHFLCYTVDDRLSKPPPDVVLEDQFPPPKIEKPQGREEDKKLWHVTGRAYLCNPVEKIHDGRKFPRNMPEAHLVCYYIQGEPYVRPVEIKNQLQPEPVVVMTEIESMLCLPSGKSEVFEDPPIPDDLDHFKCYHARSEQPPLVQVGLKDQFNDRKTVAKKLVFFCNPVDKTVQGHDKEDAKRKHPGAHLACYDLLPFGAGEKRVVWINNQFEHGTRLEPVMAEFVCVPSTKKELR